MNEPAVEKAHLTSAEREALGAAYRGPWGPSHRTPDRLIEAVEAIITARLIVGAKHGADPDEITEAEKERAFGARQYVHEATCPRGERSAGPCPSCPSGLGLVRALRVLNANPRDARGARHALHDVVCQSGCGPEDDHADRTQAKTVAALRRFQAMSTPTGATS